MTPYNDKTYARDGGKKRQTPMSPENTNQKMPGSLNKIQQPQSFWNVMVILLLAWIAVSVFTNLISGAGQKRLSYNEFKQMVRDGRITEITIQGNNVNGALKSAQAQTPSGTGGRQQQPRFVTTLPQLQDPSLLKLLEDNNVTIHVKPDEQSWFVTLLVGLLPWVLIIGFFIYSSKKMSERMGGAQGGIFGFGKSKAKLYRKSTSEVTLDDVAGLTNAKKELEEIIGYLKDPSRYQALGGKLPKGILLAGPPGTGKTLLARAVAGEAQVPFFSISGSEFIEMFVGVGASRVRDMFDNAKKDAPAIIFIDEIDAIGRVRGTGLGGGHDEREQTLNQILAEMDGFSPRQSVIVLAATNRPDVLDPALVRPGRFDRQITLERPQREARKEILKIHTRNMPLADDVDLETVARRTVGFSGADLENLANEAALLGARKDEKKVTAEDFDQAVDKIILGVERDDLVNEDEKKIIAHHEAGHAMMAKLLPKADPLKKVSIIPRGRSLGATEQLPEEDRLNMSKTYLLDRIAILLGGRVAEKMFFDDITSGAGDDLKKATYMARKMVCQLGMSDKIGPVTFQHGEEHPFLGREITQAKDFSEHTARMIDEEVRAIVSAMEQKATEMLEKHKDRITAVAEALLEHETLSNEEIDELLGSEDNGPGDEKTDRQQ